MYQFHHFSLLTSSKNKTGLKPVISFELRTGGTLSRDILLVESKVLFSLFRERPFPVQQQYGDLRCPLVNLVYLEICLGVVGGLSAEI
jgi:hypothetical protein